MDGNLTDSKTQAFIKVHELVDKISEDQQQGGNNGIFCSVCGNT
jgi:hypothetical protein